MSTANWHIGTAGTDTAAVCARAEARERARREAAALAAGAGRVEWMRPQPVRATVHPEPAPGAAERLIAAGESLALVLLGAVGGCALVAIANLMIGVTL